MSAEAQWLNQPMAGAPRTPDGKVNMTGPVPRLDGKPDLSGIWQVQAEPRAPGGLFGLGESPNSRYFRDILADFKPDERPLTPAGAEAVRQHGLPGAFNPTLNCLPDGVPHGDLLPEPFKIFHTPGVIIMLYEVETTFRQIFMDGRKLPVDPSPTWQGYSVGRWEGDTLVVETTNFRDDSAYRGANGATLRLTERFTRVGPQTVKWAVTIEDPMTWTKPWTFAMPLTMDDTQPVLEYSCHEGNLGLRNILSAARAEEKKAEEAAKAK